VIKSWQMGRGLDTRTVSCYTGALRHHLLALYIFFIGQPSNFH